MARSGAFLTLIINGAFITTKMCIRKSALNQPRIGLNLLQVAKNSKRLALIARPNAKAAALWVLWEIAEKVPPGSGILAARNRQSELKVRPKTATVPRSTSFRLSHGGWHDYSPTCPKQVLSPCEISFEPLHFPRLCDFWFPQHESTQSFWGLP